MIVRDFVRQICWDRGMDISEIIDLSEFRVRMPAGRNSGPGRRFFHQLLEVRRSDECHPDTDCWQSIPVTIHFQGVKIFSGRFEERNCFNIPGPFYGAQTDTCETGPDEAPDNILLDGNGPEVVFRQPTTIDELQRIIGAACADPFSGYGADGNEHWNLRLIREWWQDKESRLAQIGNLSATNQSTDQWLSYSMSQSESYLRCYAFFIENRRLPKPADHLPDL